MYLGIAPLVLALVLAWASQAPAPSPAQGKNASDGQTSTVSGIVVRSMDSAPLKNATVHLESDSDREHKIATKTAADGHFELKNVPAGQYRLMVRRNGYVSQELGQKKPGDPGATFTLGPSQQKTDLVFKLGRAAVISGRIYDEDGEPMAGVSVLAMRQVYREGRRQLGIAARVESDDLGEYRLFGLAPGRYYVSAETPNWNRVVGDREFSGSNRNGGEKGYAKIYYPSALEFGKASSIYVKEGDEIPSTDILMREVTVYRVRGKVAYLFPHKGKNDTQLQVMRRGQQVNWDFVSFQSVDRADGTFEIPELQSGEYTVTANYFDQGKNYSTQEDVDVFNADVDGFTLILGESVNIQGRVLWEGKVSLVEGVATIGLYPAQSGTMWGGEAHVDENNRFTLKEVPQGTFHLNVDGISKDCYIKEVRLGESLVPDQIVQIKRGGASELEITVSSRGARLQGTVLNEEKLPVAGVWVVAVPEETKRSLHHLYKPVTTDQYGHYDLRGLTPGEYTIFSWDGIERGEWEDSDFLKATEAKGVVLDASDGDTKSTDLQLIQMKDTTSKSE